MRWLMLIVLCCCAALATADIRLTDDTGTEVVLPRPAQRIISLAPHITESVFAVGGGARIVGAVSHSDYPAEALDIPRVGNYKKVSYEQIAALKPDLVLAFGSGNGWDMVKRLRELGFTVYVDEPRSLEDVAKSLQHFAQLTGTEAEGQEQVARFQQTHAQLKKRYAKRSPITVFYEVWNEPLITINDKHLIADVIRLCGGVNIFKDAVPLIPKVSTEAVIRRNPDVIIASGMGEERPQWLDAWEAWSGMTAVAKQQLYFVPPDLLQRHTPRILEGAEMMCRLLEQARSG